MHLDDALHVPATQVSPAWHEWPHAPQLLGSVAVFTHEAPHIVSPAGHTQVLLTQVWPGAHTVPQLPQLFGSVAVFTHAVPHSVPVHLPVMHAPATQVSPDGHTLPQRPQLFASVWRFAHEAPHAVSPGPHTH